MGPARSAWFSADVPELDAAGDLRRLAGGHRPKLGEARNAAGAWVPRRGIDAIRRGHVLEVPLTATVRPRSIAVSPRGATRARRPLTRAVPAGSAGIQVL